MGTQAALDKLQVLSADSFFEIAEDVDHRHPKARTTPPGAPGALNEGGCAGETPQKKWAIYNAAGPGGRRIPLLKTMITNSCERDCNYCPFRSGRDIPRTTLEPHELARACKELHHKKAIDGVFISSALLGGGVNTQTRIIEAAEILRERQGFAGYIHLKLMPGAEFAQVERAMQLADRVSVNLEAPTEKTLTKIAPHKRLMDELVEPMRYVERIRRSHGGRPGGWHNAERSGPSQTTQFVVGPGGEVDRELLRTTEYLRRTVNLARAYFSTFHPVRDTPMENLPSGSPIREHRLYQSDFLLRDYGFRAEEFVFDEEGNLLEDIDPKLAWAQKNICEEPIEVNRARKEELMRIPGIGPKGASNIMRRRRESSICDLQNLRSLGVLAGRAAPFVLLNGRRPDQQLELPLQCA